MNKKFFHFFVLILFSFISQVSANDSQWHLLSSSPSVNVFVNTQQIIYEQGTDTARFWTKSSFPTGNETLMQYEVNYKDKTMLLLTMKDAKTGEISPSFKNSPAPPRKSPIPPEGWMDNTANIIAIQLGRPPLYTASPYNWVKINTAKYGDTYILPDFLNYNKEENSCDIWVKQVIKWPMQGIRTHKYRFFFTDKSLSDLSTRVVSRTPIVANSENELWYNTVKNLVFKTK